MAPHVERLIALKALPGFNIEEYTIRSKLVAGP
jgi:hypothetical protein